MRPTYNIDTLRRRRSRNVREQVAVTRDDIRREAEHWRENPIRTSVREVFAVRGIDIDRGIFNSVTDRDYGEDCTRGTFVTSDERFIDFEIELSPDGNSVVEVAVFTDVTAEQDICGRKPGIGATRPFLIIEVLRELNHTAETDHEAEGAEVW